MRNIEMTEERRRWTEITANNRPVPCHICECKYTERGGWTTTPVITAQHQQRQQVKQNDDQREKSKDDLYPVQNIEENLIRLGNMCTLYFSSQTHLDFLSGNDGLLAPRVKGKASGRQHDDGDEENEEKEENEEEEKEEEDDDRPGLPRDSLLST
ncbi:hypothetical protein KQX54_007946 [Cotesia glomerata]|uniref:Uncharacterized protein n=1 Tax=Cotesia glomerata TaxID=32391 RepID=A0AAV7IKN0_COTGL|nr:hypothetical protein KQX54_007946 [Cotesia glomerata]